MTAQRRLGIVTLVIMLGLAGWSWHLLQRQRGAGRTPAPTSMDSNVPKALAVHTQARAEGAGPWARLHRLGLGLAVAVYHIVGVHPAHDRVHHLLSSRHACVSLLRSL